MTTEEDAQLRYLLRQLGQLPQPDKDLLGRVSKKFSILNTTQKARIQRDVAAKNKEAEEKQLRRVQRFEKKQAREKEEQEAAEQRKKEREEKEAAEAKEAEEKAARKAARAERRAQREREEEEARKARKQVVRVTAFLPCTDGKVSPTFA